MYFRKTDFQDETTDELSLLMKGADTVMAGMVQYNDWLEEECSNMAREGLRTLVVAKKTMTSADLEQFEKAYHQAKVIYLYHKTNTLFLDVDY